MISRVVLTDLDGTLLDHQIYGFEPARPALSALRAARIPLVFCSSKTEAEMRELQREMDVEGPLICENGGAVLFDGGEPPLVIGTPAEILKKHLDEVVEEVGLTVRTLAGMEVREIMELTGLSEARARLARMRAYSVPFLPDQGAAVWEELRRSAREKGLEISRGGRFFHMTGGNDKGKAARLLLLHWKDRQGYLPRSLGLGDSQNDLELLREVDVPVRIPNPWSQSPLKDELPWGIPCDEPGPAGWGKAVLEWLRRESPAKLAGHGESD